MNQKESGSEDLEAEPDVEGHLRARAVPDDEDDVEGHHRALALPADDEDDVEGHAHAGAHFAGGSGPSDSVDDPFGPLKR